MDRAPLHLIGNHLNLEPKSLTATKIDGGFTSAEKFIVQGESHTGESTTVFAKMGKLAVHPNEAPVLDTEAFMYRTLQKYPAAKRYLPEFYGYIRTDTVAILLLEHLGNATWAGPWTRENVIALHNALSELHATPITPQDAIKIHQAATSLRETLSAEGETSFNHQQKVALIQKHGTPRPGHLLTRAGKHIGRQVLHSATSFCKQSPATSQRSTTTLLLPT